MATIEQLEKEIKEIKERNKRVEADKAWEISWVRRVIIVIFIYLSVGIYFKIINFSQPWLNAIVPAAAFMLSTFILPFLKKVWLKNHEI